MGLDFHSPRSKMYIVLYTAFIISSSSSIAGKFAN